MTRSPLALCLAVLVLMGCAHGRDVTPADARQFQLDWQVTKDSRGTIIRGLIGNPYGAPARDIHLLVEGLDAGGKVVTTTTSTLKRIVPSGERAPFDVFVRGEAERYRVSVVSYDLVLPRGGR